MIRFDEDSLTMKDWQNFHSKTFSLYQIRASKIQDYIHKNLGLF